MGARREQSGLADKILIQIGAATCEKAAGSDRVMKEFQRLIKRSNRDDIILRKTGCTSRCAREPIVGVFMPGEIPIKYEKVDAERVQRIYHEHVIGGQSIPEYVLDKTTEKRYEFVITVCSADNCGHKANPEQMLRDALTDAGVEDGKVRLFSGTCFGLCSGKSAGQQHVMMVFPERVLYSFETRADLDEIIESHIKNHKVVRKFETHGDFITEQFYSMYGDVSFFNKQTRLTLRNSGLIDPDSLVDYVMNKGYEALAKTLDNGDPEWVIDEISRSGLRGRGGGGFPTGVKWRNAITYTDDPVRYVICNADEGDPGAFMDRSVLEGNPHSVIEGMIIGAFTIGSDEGYVYVRHEYPLAVERLGIALQQAREMGFLGENILGSGLNFDIKINRGGGAFVCGESTALMASIEGKVGEPRAKHIHTVVSGLNNKPSNLNNVETWANVPLIIDKGSDWYTAIGTDNNPGTKIFSLVGKVNNTGLVEAPMGMTLRQIIFDVGGGIVGGKEFKAVQTGGPSGGCLPADKLDLSVDFDTLWNEGSMMGSGGMIVMDERTCMVDVATYFLGFLKFESCGKCTTCREGIKRLHELVTDITEGRGTEEHIKAIEDLADTVEAGSLCALGTTAINPVRSTLKLFRDEYMAHIKDKKCPAAVCKELITYTIDPDACTGCLVCKSRCPQDAVIGKKKEPHSIIQDKCIKCGICEDVCKFDSVRVS